LLASWGNLGFLEGTEVAIPLSSPCDEELLLLLMLLSDDDSEDDEDVELFLLLLPLS